MAKVTPIRQQYLDIKAQHPDAILMFRLGDFYEMFDSDAEIAARELDLTLTGRNFSSEGPRVPMAGVPYHAAEGYVAKLVERGYHVAICDQISEPDGKGPVDRAVTRVVTPGTVIEPGMLADNRPNYLMAIVPIGRPAEREWKSAGVAYVDVSTGEFAATQINGEDAAVQVLEELTRLSPSEVIMPQTWAELGVSLPPGSSLTPQQDWVFEFSSAQQTLLNHFGARSLDSYGLTDLPNAVCAAGAIIHYVRHTQRGSLAHLTSLRPYSTQGFMVLDAFTRRNLELVETTRSRTAKGSLLSVLDRTVTPMGARLLHGWVNQPLLDLQRLNARLDAVEALTQDETVRAFLRDQLRTVSDIERLTNRVLIGRAGPRDLLGLAASLKAVPALRDTLTGSRAFEALVNTLDPVTEVVARIEQAIPEDAPGRPDTIGTIRPGFSEELDAILAASRDAREWIANLEPYERERTGIPSLKVGFNKVFGYYIEVTHANTPKVPDDYIRKQTMVNAERYITPDLKEYEALVLNAEEQILAVERQVFQALCEEIGEHSRALLKTARAIAHLDVLAALADVAVREGYCRPQLTDDDRLIIRDGRHPVVERTLPDGTRYVPNNTHFDSMSRVHIITGPNMAGKSTYIRQVALIVLLAQIGSFVPADEAIIGLVDRIFARIGAQDEIHAGQSTFMVEMVETARLLTGSTRRSLLILDEVGRGTSTYDGMAIARAVVEYIHNHPRLNCRTLFATHYHELVELPNILPRTRNFNVAAVEDHGELVFLHKLMDGGADRSYGVHVAQIAGLPKPVIDRAEQLLRELEERGSDFKVRKAAPAKQFSFFETHENPAIEAIRSLKIDELSPIEALTKLYELRRLAGD
ncbi:MAG: DNA mismatch repair protein MutS [Anaerolineae bacterium]|jgi:DNA mismatch repair protein MutS|nr:DNA mismatch repair protein MutS [Chloroflexota bacterium]MBV6435609.1 DNA mismatch repair protein MutS [Anaerolineae bacterium]MDL1916101.1 DNA mismatch repair protein MutS [Anaerolineae bacterium CFX4]OQY86519.1 MAG: DNA mismatch repair protein MutS [Anaerolineae bacterium UTCFX5]MCO6443517.1 DNA mismatch repair protein MutS [Anaerolineae bacterium]